MDRQDRVASLTPARLSLSGRLLETAARHLEVGSLELRFPGRSPRLFAGSEDGPRGVLEIIDPAFLRRVLVAGDLGFAEAWMQGQWTSPDLPSLLECLVRNRQAFDSLASRPRLLQGLQWLHQRFWRDNHRRGSRRNIADHYDLGNEFYRLWLDPELNYSCAHFNDSAADLPRAQWRKCENILDMIDARPGDHILEIGCGWGGFAIHAAKHRDCRVTAVTVSRAQLAEARSRARAAGVARQVDFQLRDYRDVSERHDHVVSIEMFEAVGERWWPEFFRSLHRCLRPGGRAAIQVITIDDAIFPDYRRRPDFIQRYIFPGGLLPSPSEFERHARAQGLAVEHRSFRGEDYARTLALWRRQFGQVEDEVRALGFDRRFIRMWDYYLAYCEAGFRAGTIDLMNSVLVSAR